MLGGRAPTLADLKQLPYTEMVVKESMRLYPPAYSFGRMAIEDMTIRGYDMPANSDVNIFSYFTHRDPRWWDEPEQLHARSASARKTSRTSRTTPICPSAAVRASASATASP